MDVDPSVLEAITSRLGDRGPTFRSNLIQTWRNEMALRLAELDAAVSAGDVDGVARVAHTLKSSSASLGALPLSRTCEDIEHRLRAGGTFDLAAEAAAIRMGVDGAATAFTALWPS